MPLCSFCRAIDISTLPTFTGFTKTLWPHDVHKVPCQPHHPSLRSLKLSARICSGCTTLLDGLSSGFRHGPIPHGVSLKHYGAKEFATDYWDASNDEQPVVLRGLGREGFTNEKKQLFGLLAQCGSYLHEFGLFATAESHAAAMSTVVGRKPANLGEVGRIREWLQICSDTHLKCSSYQHIVSDTLNYPTRVLDLDTGGLQDARLVSGADLAGKYIALSHCWGKSPVVRTTKDTFHQFTNSIDIGCLNKTFRDTIAVTRSLGIRYLWIDSLCIIQDDAEDWEREAARMAQVYSQAYLTIAASAASDGTQGLLHEDPSGSSFQLYDDLDGNSLNKDVSIGPAPLRFRRLIVAPLNTRAWTLQERILAPRILHYARDQIHWECREMIVSEAEAPPFGELIDTSAEDSFHTGWLGRISKDLLRPDGDTKEPSMEESGRGEYETWYGMVQVYTQRNLTKDDDKLPALSGIAHAYSQRHLSDYIAGLWLGDIARGLLWFSRTSESLQRPTSYRAPSWSWASVEGSVDFFSISAGTILDDSIEIYDATSRIELQGHDAFGKVKWGELILWGGVKQAQLKTIWEDGEYDGERLSTQMLFDEKSAIGSATLDFPAPDGQVTCLLIANGYHSFGIRMKSNLVLILSPTGGENEFRRLGMSIFFEKRDYNPERATRPVGVAQFEEEEKLRLQMIGDSEFLENWFHDVDYTEVRLV